MTQAAQLAQYGSNNVGLSFKNRIINGDMTIDQRNAGASVSSGFSVDRFGLQFSASSKFTAQQNAGSVTPPTGFSNYLGCTSSAATSLGSTDYFGIYQNIEGFNFSDMQWGTANAATVTLSFWVRSSLTGTFGGALRNSANNRSYPFTYTVSSANTWIQASITIAGDTTGTWVGATNGIGVAVLFSLGTGSTLSGTAGAWAGSNFLSATGATSVVGTNGATFYITGVQLEKGSVATSFDYLPYSTEFDLCRRYFEIIRLTNNGTLNQYPGAGVAMAWGGGDVRMTLQYYPKRANPTCTMSGSIRMATSSYGVTLNSFLFDSPGPNTVLMYNTSSSGFTIGNALQAFAQDNATFISFSAEL